MRCFCIGHRDTPEGLYPQVLQVTKELAKNGVTEFIVGGYGNFDRMAARAVNAIKARYAVRLTFLMPYRSRPVPDGFDEAWCPFTSAACGGDRLRVPAVRDETSKKVSAAVEGCRAIARKATFGHRKGAAIIRDTRWQGECHNPWQTL